MLSSVIIMLTMFQNKYFKPHKYEAPIRRRH